MKGYFRKRGCKCDGKRCTCDATWSFSLDLGRDPRTGKRKQKTVSGFKTKKEAQLAAAAIQQELSQGTFIAEKDISFKEFVSEWIKLYQTSVKVSTVRVRHHESGKLMEYFEGYQVKQVSKKMYQDVLVDLYEKGYALNTIAGIHSTGKMIFSKAIELEVIKNDPTQYAKLPRPQKTVEEIENEEQVIKYLEKEELARFLQIAKEQGLERDYAIFTTLAYSGLRVGELCAMKWRDLSFTEHTVSITKTYYNPKNRATDYQLLTPKTSTSRRSIELEPSVFKELEKLKAKQNELKMLNRDVYYDKILYLQKLQRIWAIPNLLRRYKIV